MGNIKVSYKPSRSADEPGKEITDPKEFFTYIFGEGYGDMKRLYDQLPDDQKLKICQNFGGDATFMDSANRGSTWADNQIQDGEIANLTKVMGELQETLKTCNDVEQPA